MSELKVNSIKGTGASTAAITIDSSSGGFSGNITNRQGKNLIINGEMMIAQRGTSSASSGYQTVDRFFHEGDGWDEAMTVSQSDVASGTTPYTSGFRKAFKLQNGNQTSGAGAGDTLVMLHRIEAQDLANSGWNYTSTSSNVSFSFWVKSSVAQNFFFTFKTADGTPQKYAMETGSLTADTWTKITKTIPGNSNIQFDNDNGEGLEIEWSIFRGTDETGSMSLNTWAANNNSVRTPDQTSTWFTTNDATFEITGVQLEVGSVATDFEHQCHQYHLYRCYRYYIQRGFEALMGNKSGTNGFPTIQYPVVMRDTASVFIQRNGNNHEMRNQNDGSSLTGISTYNQYDYGFASRGGGSHNIIYASTYYADAEL